MDKWTRKYLKIAKVLADDNDACYSRKIGVVLVGSNNRVISMGYNGSIEKAPHTDSPQYLEHLYLNLLTDDDRTFLSQKNLNNCQSFVDSYSGKKICPRKIFNIKSGERLDLCNCAHAERNCLASANQSGVNTTGSTLYCYCAVPCHECAIQIIQAKISRVICLKAEVDYSKSSRGLFQTSGVELIEVDQSEV